MTFDRPALDPALRDAVSYHDLATIVRRTTPGPQRSAARIREDLAGEDAQGNTLWLLAAYYGDLPILEYLAPRSARHHRNAKGASALHQAAIGGHTRVVDALLDRWDQSARALDHRGQTPLMNAAQGGHALTVEHLLPVSDPTVPDADGLNALSHAWRQRHWHAADRIAQALPADRVVPSIEAVLAGALNPAWVQRRLPRWSVAQERRTLRTAIEAERPLPTGPEPSDAASPRARPRL